MNNYQVILNDSDEDDAVVWLRSSFTREELERITGKPCYLIPREFKEEDGIDGEISKII